MTANGWNGWGPALGYAATTGNMNLFFPSNNALANALYANNNRISELPGMRRYYVADRNRDKVRTSLNLAGDRSAVVPGRGGLQQGRLPHLDLRPAGRQGLGRERSMATYALTDGSAPTCSTPTRTQRSVSAGNTYHGQQQCQHA